MLNKVQFRSQNLFGKTYVDLPAINIEAKITKICVITHQIRKLIYNYVHIEITEVKKPNVIKGLHCLVLRF